MKRACIALGLFCLASTLEPTPAAANGRFPATVNTRFQPGDTEQLLVPATFGLLSSTDGGESFRWICEETIGYGGTYDPDYAIAPDGKIYATTFDGLRVSSDGSCTYEDTAFYNEAPTDTPTTEPLVCVRADCTDDDEATICGCIWVGEVEVASDGSLWAATSTGGERNRVYRSTDGQRFFVMGLESDTTWWKTIRVAASDPQRVYVTGFEPAYDPDGAGELPIVPAEATLYRSVDGGATWEELGTDDFTFGQQPNLYLMAVSPTDPDLVFARVLTANDPSGDALYRSTDGGVTWTKSLDFTGQLTGVVVRADGNSVIAGSPSICPGDSPELAKGCVRISDDGGATWEVPFEEPKMGCLGERSDGTLFACGANWEPDFFAYGSSLDGHTWDPTLRFSEIVGPLECPTGTEQHECAALLWQPLCEMLGICATGDNDAGPGGDGGSADGGNDDGDDDGGCGCRTGGGAAGSAALAMLLYFGPLWAIRKRRRRRR